jgi:hypothetical protein
LQIAAFQLPENLLENAMHDGRFGEPSDYSAFHPTALELFVADTSMAPLLLHENLSGLVAACINP